LKYKKLFYKYAEVRGMPKQYADTAVYFYQTLNERDKALMVKEFKKYIQGVKKGDIIKTPVPIPKPRKVKLS